MIWPTYLKWVGFGLGWARKNEQISLFKMVSYNGLA